jgi:dTDP-glucose 4,6-dehydratase
MDVRRPKGAPHDRLISFVTDRLGHDWRYAIDGAKIQSELGWRPRHTVANGLANTLNWYLE